MESTSSTLTPEEELFEAMRRVHDAIKWDALPPNPDARIWVGGEPLTPEEFMGRYGKKPKPKKPKPKY